MRFELCAPWFARLGRALVLLLAAGFCQAPWDAHGILKENEPRWQVPGVAYFCDNNPRLPLVVHVVRIDRSQKDLEFHTTLGGGNQIGLAELSDQVKFIDPKIGQPLAAINGDYFHWERPYGGAPMNLQVFRGGELVSAPGLDRAFFYVDARGEPHLTNAVNMFSVTWPNGKTTPIGLNRIPETGEAMLYTRLAGPNTRVEGTDLILERSGPGPWLPLRLGQKLTARVRQVNKAGYSSLQPDGLVLSLSPRTLSQLPPLAPGLELKISTATVPDLSDAVVAIGGGPSLVRGGKVRELSSFMGFQMRHPRSAMGWNNQYYYFVQADGRQPRYSMGMSLREMANYFVSLKCESAINLDGGGSCTTWFAGNIVNSPSQRRERAAANALVVVRKAKTAN